MLARLFSGFRPSIKLPYPIRALPAQELHAPAWSRCGEDPPENNTHTSARLLKNITMSRTRGAMCKCILNLLMLGNLIYIRQTLSASSALALLSNSIRANINNHDYGPLFFGDGNCVHTWFIDCRETGVVASNAATPIGDMSHFVWDGRGRLV